MKKWIALWLSALCLMLLLVGCGKDPAVTPDADLPSEDPVADAGSTPEDTVEDTTPLEDTTPPAEEVKMPFIPYADYIEFIYYANENLRHPPFEFDDEFDSLEEGEYYTVLTENPNPEQYLDPNGGCITMVVTAEGRLARLRIDYAADVESWRVFAAAASVFDDDDDEARQWIYAIEEFIEEAMKPDAPAQSTLELGDMVICVSRGFKDILPLCFYMEAKGASEFMAAYPIENAAE